MIYFKQTGESFSDIYLAREAVLRFARCGEEKKRLRADLLLDAGEYTLTKPLVFSQKEEDGLWRTAISLSCENGKAVFSSFTVLKKEDFEKKENYYIYRFPKDENGRFPCLRDLFLNGRRLPICKGGVFTHTFAFSEENGRDNRENLEGIYVPEEAAQSLACAEIGAAELTLHFEWEFFTLHVLGADTSRTKTDENGEKHVLLRIKPDELYTYVTKMNPYLNPKNREFYLGNSPALLGEETWCYDAETGVLCYRPRGGLCGEISVATLEKLLCFEGMDGITLQNLAFTGATDK